MECHILSQAIVYAEMTCIPDMLSQIYWDRQNLQNFIKRNEALVNFQIRRIKNLM